MKLSILIANYNYAKYLRAAIDSALALKWPDKEVIVADDGSTDGSREIILAYGSEIVPIFLSNGGQSSAFNAAFNHSTGDIIIFLDSDDVLFPFVAETVRAAWYEGVSKVQWSLVIVDETLVPLGSCIPTYRHHKPTPEWVGQTLVRTGNCPYSLGGAWARSFLSQVFPLPVREGVPRSGGANGDFRIPIVDRYLSYLAPFFGNVVFISHHDPQGAYRMHSSNNHYGAQALEHLADCCAEQLECTRRVNELLASLAISTERINAERDQIFMHRQLSCQRLNLNGRYRSFLQSLWKYWRAVALDEAQMAKKLTWVIWSLLVAGPRPVSMWAIHMRLRRSVLGRRAAVRMNRHCS